MIGMRLAQELRLDPETRSDLFYALLLKARASARSDGSSLAPGERYPTCGSPACVDRGADPP
jgi:hypothetical protein